ncbi:IgaA/UmoB family intracellular growth attenuator [Sodalis praecaptivus]|uniref:IgaA/UmoB family intracellular growth attenuator n=1 Tax=Sodalis praecaptivus TaxID=1239307 RepID=UPI0027FC183C|nr:IgaA/UmoB family intracellular growth attenuator [Sodalis praecaptivus]CAJ0994886.1 Putative membrane protein IgaA [Sodalis praecaptivus]
MSAIVFVLAGVLACAMVLVVGWRYYRRRARPVSVKRLSFIQPFPRKLTAEERAAIEHYLHHSQPLAGATPLSAPEPAAAGAPLTPRSENVYSVTHAITRYGLATDAPHKWRYYLDNIEIHLPAQWEQFIAEENHVELIRTDSMPLVISLNGHTLVNYAPSAMAPARAAVPNSSMREQGNEQVELLKVRKETPQERAISRPSGRREALLCSAALLLILLSLLAPIVTQAWLAALAGLPAALAAWLRFRPTPPRNRQDIHCLRGIPRRWGLFGESGQGSISNISLGSLDLKYPAHWQPYIARDLDQKTDIDIYVNSQVVRQGRYLSLHDEVSYFPLQRWGGNLIMLCSSLLVLALLLAYVPLSLKLSVAWLQGAQTVRVDSVAALNQASLRIGDTLSARGTGMCYIQSDGGQTPFFPFDCSAIYWNNAVPLPMPESDTVDRAEALLAVVNNQLHPVQDNENKITPGLASAIQKSGMILLDDFSDIVLKTLALCQDDAAPCHRLQAALVNLANGRDWPTIVKRARAGSLKGINVLLRPVSADTLEGLINAAAAYYFTSETRNATNALNSPPPGGFLIRSDEDKQLVETPPPGADFNDYAGLAQWHELQRLSSQLLHTPFNAEGVITNITVDANGTRHIALHSELERVSLWRNVGATLLLLLLLTVAAFNTILLIRRLHNGRRRARDIQRYYDGCFNHEAVSSGGNRVWRS